MELKSDDLINIINACGKNGVNCIKIGEINIEFNGFVKVLESDYPDIVEPVDKIAVTDPNFIAQQEAEQEIEDTENLMIMDPVRWEEKLMKDELEDSDKNIEG
tara:strand:+ start:1191 stop:1499 length:309 start_codon:yes stop_codon:yes gene_type:complete